LLFCEFRSNLTRTTSHDWHVQPYCQRSDSRPALGGAFGFGRHESCDPSRRPRNLSNILRVFPCCQPMNQIRHQGAPANAAFGTWHLALGLCLWPTAKGQMLSAKPRQRRSKRTACPLWRGLSLAFSAHKGTRAFKFVKDLVLEVFGFPLTLPSSLAQHPAPWPGQLFRSVPC